MRCFDVSRPPFRGRVGLSVEVLTLSDLLVAASSNALANSCGAELILYDGKVITVDARFSIHQAVAIAKGKILSVGDDKSVLAFADGNTKLVDLQGKAVIPGLIDDHYHMLSKAVD